MDDSLTKFVRDKLDEGYSNQRIREILFDEGFLPSEIEQAFFEAEAIGKQPLEEGLTVRELKPEIPKVISEQEFIGEEKPDKPLVKEFKKGLSSFKVKKRGFKIKDNLGIGIVKTFKKFLPEKFITPKNRHLLVIAGLILAIIFLGGIGYVLYNNLSSRDPVSLIPEETDFYVRIKINSQNKQVQQFKDLIKKFPNYNLAEEKWAQAFEQINKENPIFEEVLRMFSKSSDLILATDTLSAAEPAKVLIILANPDLKELQKTKNDLEDFISQNNNWQMTKEKYRGKELVKIVYEGNLLPPELGLYYGSLSKQEIFSSFLGRNLILTNSFEEIKKVIDVFKSRGLANIFSSNKIKAITDNPAHKKLQKYLNKDYLVGYYIGLESLGIMQLTGANQFLTQNQDKAFINNFLKAAINLPLVASEAENKNNLSNQKRFALSSFFRVDENGLSSETYYLDSEKQIFLPAQFLLSESLANFLPEKIGIKEVVYYAESKDLNGLFQTLEQEAVKAMSPEQRIDYEETLVVLNEILGSDLKQEILPLFKSNFSFFVMAESDGREAPLVGIIFDIADENLVKSEILKVKIPKKILESFSGNMGDILSKKDDFVSFQKEIVDNFEIYSLPVIQEKQGGNWGLNFSLNKKKLILSFSKDGLINILRGLKAGTKSLRESERFSIQIVNAPRNVGEISYIYPYGFLGAIKYAINFYLDFQATFLSGEQTSKEEIALMQEMASSIFQFLDKAIAPYLKMFASVGGYSFTPENGLVVKKSKIAIEELSDWEKEQVETFWFNIDDWINQRFGAFAF